MHHSNCSAMENHASSSSASLVPKKRRTTTKPPSGTIAKRVLTTSSCSECGKRFWSKKALYGHMRCHPERQWRGMKPPTSTVLLRLCSAAEEDERGHHGGGSSSELTEEEHKVASYLLLLANSEPLTMLNSITGAIVIAETDHSAQMTNCCGRFECSNCKKVFPSHQALGGHRASHKNVKGCYANNRIVTSNEGDCRRQQGLGGVFGCDDNNLAFVMMNEVKVNVVHKCWICMRVFASGQALGGHMRCHWEKSESSVPQSSANRNNARPFDFEFDLNSPARVVRRVDYRADGGGLGDSACSPGRDLDLRLRF